MSRLRSPALHMAALGSLLFAASWLVDKAPLERPQIQVSRHQLELTLQNLSAEKGRAPTPAEVEEVREALIDQEVLYQYALTLGMHEHPAAQRRLAQIAEFVASNPHHDLSEAERAREAMELGLHQGDLVVRRILIDSATRLIRAVVLIQEPTDAELEDYLRANAKDFELPVRVRLSQVTINGFRWHDTRARAMEVLARIRRGSLDIEAAVALGDGAFVKASLPSLTQKALATKFGEEFATQVIALPAGSWAGPVESRYGDHLVYVHERLEVRRPALEDVRELVADGLRQERADEWLALRLDEIRREFDIVAQESRS